MAPLKRLWRHLWLDAADARRALDSAAMDRLQQRVAQSERRHTGEIRVCVEAGLPLSYLRRNASARERAVMMFAKLRVWDTEHDNGVLIYLQLADHAIEIVADRALSRLVPQGEWDTLAAGMANDFRDGRFEAGLLRAIEAVEGHLVQHFPLAEGAQRANELPDRPFQA
jgi:uncharacterized membrane protein